MRTTGPRVGRMLALVAACGLSGACATTRYTQSRIETAEGAPKARSGEAVSVDVEGVKVRVESLDRAPRGQVVPTLALRLRFEPEALGYSFDPGQVLLRGADGREWRPAASGYQPLLPRSEAVVDFGAAVEPGQRMDLVIAGLARGPRPLAPVTLRLARHDGRSYDRLYWLEAVATVLMAPLALAGGGL